MDLGDYTTEELFKLDEIPERSSLFVPICFAIFFGFLGIAGLSSGLPGLAAVGFLGALFSLLIGLIRRAGDS
jgi:hypothetical protein